MAQTVAFETASGQQQVDVNHPLPVEIGATLTLQGDLEIGGVYIHGEVSGNKAEVTSGNSLKVDGSSVTQPVSVSSLPLPADAATATAQGTAQASLTSIDSHTASIDTKLSGSIAVTGPLTDAQLRATPIDITGSISATNPSVGTNAAAIPGSSTLIGWEDGSGDLQPVSATAPLPVSGTVAVSGTIPVSGTIAATQSGTWTVSLDSETSSDSGAPTLGESPDSPSFVSLVGEPGGNFAGVNLIEELMDDKSGIGLGVRVLNPPTVGPDGALQITDGKLVPVSLSATGIAIFDTLGYSSLQITTVALAGTLSSSNNMRTWTAISGMTVAGVVSATIAANTNYIFPCPGRYIRIASSAIGTAAVYLRSAPFSVLAAAVTNAFNLSQVGGTNVVSSGVAGVLSVGGNTANGAAITVSPVLMGGADPSTLARRFITDTTGAQIVGGVDAAATRRPILADTTGAQIVSGYRLPPVPPNTTVNPLPAYIPPLPVQTVHRFEQDLDGGQMDTLRLMLQALLSIDRRLQSLPANIINSNVDTDDFSATDSQSILN